MSCPPVVLIIFNRPSLVARTFAAIRAARPSQLLVVADGPRLRVEGESELCREARDAVGPIDWLCDLRWNLAEENICLLYTSDAADE